MFFLWQSVLATAKAQFVQVGTLTWHRMAILSTICQYGIQTFNAIVFVNVLWLIKDHLLSEEITANNFHFEAYGDTLLTIVIFSDHQIFLKQVIILRHLCVAKFHTFKIIT